MPEVYGAMAHDIEVGSSMDDSLSVAGYMAPVCCFCVPPQYVLPASMRGHGYFYSGNELRGPYPILAKAWVL